MSRFSRRFFNVDRYDRDVLAAEVYRNRDRIPWELVQRVRKADVPAAMVLLTEYVRAGGWLPPELLSDHKRAETYEQIQAFVAAVKSAFVHLDDPKIEAAVRGHGG